MALKIWQKLFGLQISVHLIYIWIFTKFPLILYLIPWLFSPPNLNTISALLCCSQSRTFLQGCNIRGQIWLRQCTQVAQLLSKGLLLWGKKELALKIHFIIAPYLLNQMFYVLKNSLCSLLTQPLQKDPALLEFWPIFSLLQSKFGC